MLYYIFMCRELVQCTGSSILTIVNLIAPSMFEYGKCWEFVNFYFIADGLAHLTVNLSYLEKYSIM